MSAGWFSTTTNSKARAYHAQCYDRRPVYAVSINSTAQLCPSRRAPFDKKTNRVYRFNQRTAKLVAKTISLSYRQQQSLRLALIGNDSNEVDKSSHLSPTTALPSAARYGGAGTISVLAYRLRNRDAKGLWRPGSTAFHANRAFGLHGRTWFLAGQYRYNSDRLALRQPARSVSALGRADAHAGDLGLTHGSCSPISR